MPTGYTCNIKDGITFKEFAMGCARAFGACIEMRDDSLDKEIPEEFETSSYHKERIEEIEKEISELSKLTEEEIKVICDKEYKEEIDRIKQAKEDEKNLFNSYANMLNIVSGYVPPSEDHINFKEFMIKQIKESIDFDCNDYYKNKKVVKQDYKTYRFEKLKGCYKDLSYHAKKYQEDLERTKRNNNWIKLLRESLKEY